MNVDAPILTSMLDEDCYKFCMGQLVFTDFPQAVVTYKFTNRGKTEFPNGFAKALNFQIELLATLSLTNDEARYLETIPGIRPNYVEWFRGYRFDPGEVVVKQIGKKLFISIKGPWYRTIFWEVRLMAIISELYFRMTGVNPDPFWISRIYNKRRRLSDNFIDTGAMWSDFGTRRRFSYKVQNVLVSYMKNHSGFLGTSNVHFAMVHGVPPIGTSAHEMVMGLSALYGPELANLMWFIHWSNHFHGLNGIALTDTFTTEVFLRYWDTYWARLFDGVRQDSGDPIQWGNNMLAHYNKLGVDSGTKKFVFSDALTVESFVELSHAFGDKVKVIGGIGTHLTNDVGSHVKPLNMVIKMATADFGNGIVDVVKLSDTPGKHTGKSEAITLVKQQLGII